jgi:hypothetical protein
MSILLNGVILEKLIGAQRSEKFPTIYDASSFMTYSH